MGLDSSSEGFPVAARLLCYFVMLFYAVRVVYRLMVDGSSAAARIQDAVREQLCVDRYNRYNTDGVMRNSTWTAKRRLIRDLRLCAPPPLPLNLSLPPHKTRRRTL